MSFECTKVGWSARAAAHRAGPPAGWVVVLAGLMIVLLLSACQSPFEKTGPKFDPRQPRSGVVTNLSTVEVTHQLPAEALQPDNQPFTLGPGDRIEVEMLGDPTTRALVTVGPDGRIYYFLLPGLDVWGLTLGQTKALLERELARYMAGVQVAVTLRGIESKRVWLLGRLQNSGIYPVGAPMTLLESISLAGGLLSATGTGTTGLEELADLRHSFIVRRGELLPVDFNRLIREGDMSQNVYLQPDDFVYVPSAVTQSIYVLGAVRVPQPIAATDQTTLITAIALTGGTVRDAYLSQVGIVRGSLSQPHIAVINYKDIVSGKAPDVRLEPQDIVYVPFNPYRTLINYADLILATFARAVAINEGARAVSRDAAPVGVNIGIGVVR